jgi:hypothetical protein
MPVEQKAVNSGLYATLKLNTMKTIRISFLLVLSMIIGSCSPVTVITDMDQEVDFTRYKTYHFLGWQDDSDRILSDFDKKRIHDAFVSEFKARGMELVEEGGDMAVSLFLVVEQKTSTTAYTDYYGSHYGFYHRYPGGWGYGYANTTYSENDYLEGTLVVDAFDSETNNQVWQGIVRSTVNENPQTRDKTIPKKIATLMKKFPVPKLP